MALTNTAQLNPPDDRGEPEDDNEDDDAAADDDGCRSVGVVVAVLWPVVLEIARSKGLLIDVFREELRGVLMCCSCACVLSTSKG